MWFEGNPCNMHLLDLAAEVKKGTDAAGLFGMRFNTIGVSDGISMGTDGMSYSLQSRDLIADSIETVMCAQWYDACIVLPGCDKNMPGSLMALGRLNRPGFMVYGGTIRAGQSAEGEKIDIVSAFTCYGAQLVGKMTDAQRRDVVRRACPGAGACGGMYTANTMATAIEAMGMTLPYSSSLPATDPDKLAECRRAGDVIRHCLEKDIKPRDMMTREAFENAMALVMAVGGSTNAVLHLIAMARAVDVPLTIDDFQRTSDRVPYLADLRPSGKYVQEDLHAGRRHAGRHEAVAGRGIDHRRLPDDHRQNSRRKSGQIACTCQGPETSSSRSPIRSRAPATSASCAAIFAPTAPWPRSPARRACGSRARQIASIRKKRCWRRMQQKRDQKGRRRRHSLRRSARRPGHAGNAVADRLDRRRRPGVRRGADHRWPLLRRLGRLHRRPRHA